MVIKTPRAGVQWPLALVVVNSPVVGMKPPSVEVLAWRTTLSFLHFIFNRTGARAIMSNLVKRSQPWWCIGKTMVIWLSNVEVALFLTNLLLPFMLEHSCNSRYFWDCNCISACEWCAGVTEYDRLLRSRFQRAMQGGNPLIICDWDDNAFVGPS